MKSIVAQCTADECAFEKTHKGIDDDEGGPMDDVTYAARSHADKTGHTVHLKRKGFGNEEIKPRKHGKGPRVRDY